MPDVTNLRFRRIRNVSSPEIMANDSITELFTSLRHRLSTVARRFCPDREDADDALQDAFLRLWSRRDSLDLKPESNPAGYVYRTVAAAATDMARRKRKEIPIDSIDAAGIEDNAGDCDRNGCQGITLAAVSATIDRELPPRQRNIMRLHDIEGLDDEEISKLLDISPQAVRTNLSRARAKIREIYSQMHAPD